MSLTNMELVNAKPRDKDYKLADGKGLYLLVKTNGAKYWRWAYRFGSKQKTMAFGVFPESTAKSVREKHSALRLVLADGFDPQEHTKQVKLDKIKDTQKGVMFNDVLDVWFAQWKTEYKGKTIVRNAGIVDNWIKPFMLDVQAKDVHATHVIGLIRRLEALDKRPTAHKLYTILKKMFSYCIADPSIPIDRNWAVDIGELRKPLLESHYAALIAPKDVGKLLHSIATSSSFWLTKLAMRLSLHWFIRPGELRNLKWEDINWDMQCVQISAEDMKKTKTVQEHWVPLTKQTKDMLMFIKHNGYASALVFPSIRDLTKPISENTVNTAIRSMGYKGKQTAHGLRATARTLLEEELGENALYVEHQLAHTVRDSNGRAYNRTTMLNERRDMLQRWSDYLDELEYKATHGIEIKSKYEQGLEV
jgi:integrase